MKMKSDDINQPLILTESQTNVMIPTSNIQKCIAGAYYRNDPLLSHKMHEEKRTGHEETHASNSKEWLKIAVFGGLDGIVTIFCVMAGCEGASLSMAQVIVIGIGNLLGDAVSMGFGEYTSAVAEEEYEIAESNREAWEMKHCPEDEQNEMIDLYQQKWGMTEEDAKSLISVMWKYPEYFLNNMMYEELDILLQSNGMSPKQKGALMAGSFVTFGSIPLTTYSMVSLFLSNNDGKIAFILTCIMASLALFVLGTVKSSLILEGFGKSRALKDGMLMFLNGSVAGIIAYSCGVLLQKSITQM
eukprot:GHVH01004079.1.p2 GENE.GHVH01004079.1~~GHVH01004079.1.p2  ORF type:complete len:301 (+),score=47.19 GHVH01004079.1:90-992(+)